MSTDSDSPELARVLERLRRICRGLPSSEEYIMVHHPAFRIGKKPFVIAGMNQHIASPTVSINLGKEAQVDLLDDSRFTKTPYIGQHGWVTVEVARLRGEELENLIEESWKRVAPKKLLSAKR